MSHLSPEALVSYLAGDAEDEAGVEQHLFECGVCTEAAERLAPVIVALQREIPTVIDRAQLAALRARGLRIRDNPVVPGARNEVVFPPDLDIVLHRLSGLQLKQATRVEVFVRVESSGQELLHLPRARFDPDAGEVLIACQRHFAALPPDTEMEVRVHAPRGGQVQRYSVLHHFQ